MSALFVDGAWLRAHLNDPKLRIVDARSMPHGAPGLTLPSGAEQFAAGHIAGAVQLDYADQLADPATPYATRVAPPEQFARAMSEAGIGDDTSVVAYDDGDVPYAARMVWMLHYYGHDDAHVLAGGFKEWRAGGGPVSTEAPHHPPARFTPRVVPRVRATREEVLTIARGESGAQLLETQRDKTYALREQDICGALRLSCNELLEDERGGRIAPAEKLAAAVERLALDRSKRTIVSCGSGVSASGAYYALREAGFSDVAVYDGSWLEWSHYGLPTVRK